MFAAQAELEVRARRAAAFDGEADEFAHPLLIQRDEGVLSQDAARLVVAEEGGSVIARDAERGLGEIIGAEGEEFRRLGDFPGLERGARQLDHGADLIGERDASVPGPPSRPWPRCGP